MKLIKKHFTMSRKDIEHEFLPDALEIKESPPSPAGRIIVWGICITLLTAIIWSFIARIDEVAAARGKLIPDGRIKVIQPAFDGVVVAIDVSEGQIVKVGQTLVELDPVMARTEYHKLDESLNIAKAEKDMLSDELQGKPLNTDGSKLPQELVAMYANLRQSRDLQYAAKRETYAHAMEEAKNAYEGAQWDLQNAMKQLAITQIEEKDIRNLVNDGGMSREDYNRKKSALIAQENDVQSKRELMEQQQERYLGAKKNYELADYEHRTEILNSIAEKEKQIVDLTSQYLKAKQTLSMTKLVSPVDGKVQVLTVTTIGGVVKPAEAIMTIVPDNTPLIIEAQADNKDIGFIRMGNAAEIKFDTYPFQRYGVVKGKVTYISPDAVEDEKRGPIYKIKVELDMSKLPHTIQIYPGMSGTVEVKTGNKRVIDFFFDPLIKYADESLGLR